MITRCFAALLMLGVSLAVSALEPNDPTLDAQIRKIVAEELKLRGCSAGSAQLDGAAPAAELADPFATAAVPAMLVEALPAVIRNAAAPSGNSAESTLRDSAEKTPTFALKTFSSSAGMVTNDRTAGNSKPSVELQASADKTTANISIPMFTNTTNDGKTIRETSWSIKASAPVDNAKEGSASFATLNGLASGVTLGGEWTTSTTPAIYTDIIEICYALNLSPPLDNCSVDNINQQIVNVIDPTILGPWKTLLATSKPSTTFSVRGEVGHKQYSYFTEPSVAASKDSKIGWSFGGSVGRVSGDRKHYFGGGFDFVHSYKDQSPRVVCAQSDEPTFDCTLGSFGPPKGTIGRLLYAEVRSAALGRPFSLKVSHNLATDKSAVDLPIFLVSNDADEFTGGLRLGWTTDDHFIAGLFVGKAFNLLGR